MNISMRKMVVTVTLSLITAGVFGQTAAPDSAQPAADVVAPVVAAEPSPIVQSVNDILQLIQKIKLPFDEQAAAKVVAEALIKQVDSFGMIITDKDMVRLTDQQNGSAYDTGLELIVSNGLPVISGFSSNAVSKDADIHVGEILEKIDGQELLSGVSMSELGRRLRSGSERYLALTLRDTNGVSREVKIERMPVQLPAIASYEDLSPEISYLKLNGVFRQSGPDIVSTIRGWSESGRYGLVVDLRGASGMDLASVGQVAGLYSEPGVPLFTVRDLADQDLEVFKAPAGTPLSMPTMVLIDEHTQGASEVLAAVLSESVRGAMIIGTPSAGDPTVREPTSLSLGIQVYTVNRKIVLPDGQIMNGRAGIQPDIVEADSMMAAPEFEPEQSPANGKTPTEEEKVNKALRQRVKNDPVLRRAVDILLGLKALNIRGPEPKEDPTN